MPNKKRTRTIVGLSFVLIILSAFFLSLGLWSDESSIIDWLKYLTTKEGNEVADTGADLSETIGEGIKDPGPGDEISDTSADLDDTIHEDNPSESVDDPADALISDEPDTEDTSPEDDATSDDTASEPEPEPDPEPEDEIDFFEHFTQGIGVLAYKYNSVGDTARGTTKSDPYVFVKVASCGMRVDIRTMPTSAFPGTTTIEGLAHIYQTDYVDKADSNESYEIIQEPFELELNGAPAARMEVWYKTSKATRLIQITVVRGEMRSGKIKGQLLESCAERADSVAYLNEMTDSVEFFEPHPVCYVGHMPDSDPEKYSVGCDDLAFQYVGVDALAEDGFTEVAMGPVTWDECAEFMREHNQDKW